MFLTDTIIKELDYFKRLNGHFEVNAGARKIKVKDADEKILYMLLSASLAMDISEDGFFENFIITDKSISNKQELLLDAYAFIETETLNEKHLHLFQYKLYEGPSHSASPVELMNFATLMNNVFVHPELRADTDLNNPVLKEIDTKVQAFLNPGRGKKIAVHCHFINNAVGVNTGNKKSIEDVLGRFEYDKQHRNFKIQIYGIKEIEELAINGKISVGQENLEFLVDGQYAYRFEDNSQKAGLGLPKRVFIGMCNVNEFIRLQNKYHHNQLYSENIRLYLGNRAAVNKDIINTITSVESIWFPYMNNGISIICDSLVVNGPNAQKKIISLDLNNMQIINGCQTVNALYSARFDEHTENHFRPSNILVKIYEIDPNQTDFKLNVIKATNNQNAVKTYSLLSNEPIQIKIQSVLKKIDYLYDRKGEAKLEPTSKVVSMPNGTLALRAVYRFEAQILRARNWQSKVFNKTEYEKIFPIESIEDNEKLYRLSIKLLISTLILDTTRDQINDKSPLLVSSLSIINKSAYYVAGYIYAKHKEFFDDKENELLKLLEDDNPFKLKSTKIPDDIKNKVIENFNNDIAGFTEFYNKAEVSKVDIDNLLKSKQFGGLYKKEIEQITGIEISD
jgi:hypothetical protein